MPGLGTIFVELDIDKDRWEKAQRQLVKDATSTSTSIERNFKNLGIKSSAEMDLMRQKIMNSFNMIAHSSKATANDIIRAEQAKNDQLKRLNDQQFGHQSGLIDGLKKNWLAYSAAAYAALRMVGGAWDEIGKAADYKERVASLDSLGAKYGTTGTKIVQSMKEASRGLVSMSEAADMAASSLNLSLTPDQMIQFTKVSEQLSDVIGGTIPESFNRMTIAAASGRLQTLAQMGILVDLNAEYKKHGDNLTEVQKQQIRLNAILEAAKAKTAELGGAVDTERDHMDRLAKTSDDVKLAFASIGSSITATVLPALTGWADGVREIASAWNDFLQGPSTMDVLKKQESDLLGKIAVIKGAIAPGAYGMNSEDAFNLAKQMPSLQRQLALVRSTMANETAGVFSGGRSAGAPAAPAPVEYSDSQLTKFAKAGKDMPDFWAYQAAERYAVESRFLDMQIQDEEAAAKAAVKSAEGVHDFWMLQAKDRYDVQARALTDMEALSAEEKKLAADSANAYKTMYAGMKGDASTYYTYQLQALDTQRAEYEKLVGKNSVTDAWYARQKKKLDQELILSSDRLIDGIRVGYERAQESMVTFALAGESIFESFTSESSRMLSDNFFNLFTGRMDELVLDWESMWEGMARTASNKLADIATNKALDAAVTGVDWLGSAMGWWAAGSWDIKKDQIAQLHKGEMVVPADEADRIRAASESGSNAALGESWGGSKSFAPGSFGAQVEASIQNSLTSSLRSFGLNKISGLIATGQISASVNPVGIVGSFAKAAMSGLYSAYKAYTDFKTIYGDVDMDWNASTLAKAMPYGKISFDDMTKNFAMWGLGVYNPRSWGGSDSGGYGSSLGTDPSDPEHGGPGLGGGVAHKGMRIGLRNDEGFLIAQRGEEVVTEKNIKRLEAIISTIGQGQGGGGVQRIEIPVNIDGRELMRLIYSLSKSGHEFVHTRGVTSR